MSRALREFVLLRLLPETERHVARAVHAPRWVSSSPTDGRVGSDEGMERVKCEGECALAVFILHFDTRQVSRGCRQFLQANATIEP
jgi:hypothetical protein